MSWQGWPLIDHTGVGLTRLTAGLTRLTESRTDLTDPTDLADLTDVTDVTEASRTKEPELTDRTAAGLKTEECLYPPDTNRAHQNRSIVTPTLILPGRTDRSHPTPNARDGHGQLHNFTRDLKKMNTNFKQKAREIPFSTFEIGLYRFEFAPKKM